MPGILTRRIGPFPGWVWAVVAGGGFLVFMYVRRRGQAGQQGQAVPVAIPQFASASGTIPYIPTGNVTGQPSQGPGPPQGPLPAQTATPGPQASASPPAALWQFGSPPNSPTVWRATQVGQQNFQQTTGGAWPGGVFPGVPDAGTQTTLGTYGWQWARVPNGWDQNTYASALNQSTQGSGSGGFGYAGSQSLNNPIGGWTVGWSPWSKGIGSGAGSTVNRTGTARTPARLRRLYGGSGDGPAGSGGGSSVNRTGARATRPLRRRTFSGR